jgi:hypothetical protein
MDFLTTPNLLLNRLCTTLIKTFVPPGSTMPLPETQSMRYKAEAGFDVTKLGLSPCRSGWHDSHNHMAPAAFHTQHCRNWSHMNSPVATHGCDGHHRTATHAEAYEHTRHLKLHISTVCVAIKQGTTAGF